jgi:hypothetical protein
LILFTVRGKISLSEKGKIEKKMKGTSCDQSWGKDLKGVIQFCGEGKTGQRPIATYMETMRVDQ